MMSIVFTIVIVTLFLWLQFLSWESHEKTSKALWIPFLWVLMVGSRSPSDWFGLNTNLSQVGRYAEGTPLDAAIYALLILGGVLVLNSRSQRMASFARSNGVLLAYFAYCAISILWSQSPLIGLKHLFKAIGDLVMVLVVLTDTNPTLAIRRLFTQSAMVLLLSSVLLIVSFPSLGTVFDADSRKTSMIGVTTHKNELGSISAVLGLAGLWSLLGDIGDRRPGRRRRLFVQSILVVTAFWLLVKSDSMTSFSCFVLASAVMIVTSRKWVAGRSSYIHCVAGGAIGLAIFAVFIDSTGTLLTLLGRNPTLTGRTEIWTAVLSFHTNPLIGTGFDSFWQSSRIQEVASRIGYTGITEAHNGFLEVYLNLGLIGVALLVSLLVRGYLRALVLLRTQPHLGQLCIVFIVTNIMFNLSEAGFKQLSPNWIAFMLATIEIPGLLPNRPAWRWVRFNSMGRPPREMRLLQ